MKKIFIALFAFFSVLAYSDNHERGTWVAAEYHFCNFNEGQDVDDLLRVVGKFNNFLDEHADKGQYDAVLLREVYDVEMTGITFGQVIGQAMRIWPMECKTGLKMVAASKKNLIKFQVAVL